MASAELNGDAKLRCENLAQLALRGESSTGRLRGRRLAVATAMTAVGGAALVAVVNCGTHATSTGPGHTIDVAFEAVTAAGIPACTASIVGDTALVTSTGTLETCNGTTWTADPCTATQGGELAYTSTSNQLWTCTNNPDGGAPLWVQLNVAALSGACNASNYSSLLPNVQGCDLVEANLAGVNLSGADLTGANLTGANLTKANLSLANLAGANLSNANLTGATGSNLVVTDVQYSALTICPNGVAYGAATSNCPVEGGASVAFRAAVNLGGAATESFPLPTSAEAGDLMIVIATPYNAGTGYTATVSSASGGAWTTVQADAKDGQYLAVFTKVLAAADLGSSVTVTMSANGGVNSAENGTFIDAYSTTAGQAVYVSSSAIGAAVKTASASVGPVATTQPNELVVIAAMQAGGAVATLPPGANTLTNNGSFVTATTYAMPDAGLLTITNGSASYPWEIAQVALLSH